MHSEKYLPVLKKPIKGQKRPSLLWIILFSLLWSCSTLQSASKKTSKILIKKNIKEPHIKIENRQDVFTIIPLPLPSFKKGFTSPINRFVSHTLDSKGPSQNSSHSPSQTLKFLQIESTPVLIIPALENNSLPKIAVFKRGSFWWLVIDEVYDVTCFKEIPPSFLKEWTPTNAPEATIVKFKFESAYQLKIDRQLTGWHLAFVKNMNFTKENFQESISKESPINSCILSLSSPIESAQTLTFSLQQQGKKQQFKDEGVGDYLTVIPLIEGTHSSLQDYTTFKFLSTLQGIVLTSFNDEIKINQTNLGFEIVENKTHYSSSNDDLKRHKYVLPRLFQLDSPLESQKFLIKKTNFLAQMKDLNQPHQDQKGVARFDLLKLYLSQGLYAEAAGELDLLKEENPSFFYAFPNFLIEGLILGLTDREDKALKIWELEKLKDEPELNLWRSLFLIKQGNMNLGFYHLYRNFEEILGYPAFFQNFLCLRASIPALLLNYPADTFLNLIKSADLTPHQREEFKLCKALQKMNKTSLEEALADFNTLQSSFHPQVRLYAFYYSTQLSPTSPQQRQEFIQLLEENRFLWRRDVLEVKLLNHLSLLYLQNDQPDKALELMRQILTYYPKTPQAETVVVQAPTIIYEYIVTKNVFSPFKAVTFYKRFKDLAPQDLERQQQITEKCIDHYLHLKLLEKAEALLSALITQIPSNTEKTITLLLKLAQAQVEDNQNDAAFTTLAKINVLPNLTATVLTQQRQLQAQILTHQYKYDEALTLLASEESPEALSQRVDIAFRAENWPQAIIALTHIMEQKKSQGDVTPDLVLNLTVAYFHDNKTQELIDLKKEYQSLMLKSPLAAPFSLLTTGPSPSKIRPSDLQQQLEESQKFNQQLTQYQNSLKKNY